MISNPFGPYKNIHEGRSCVFFGGGPTVKLYDREQTGPDVLKIGLNEHIYLDLDLDYWFMGDSFPRDRTKVIDCMEDYNNYKPNIQKFIRHQNWGSRGSMPPDMKYSKYYPCDVSHDTSVCHFKREISDGSLFSTASTSFEVLQFILYTGIKNIYLVGHDCNYSKGTFRTNVSGVMYFNEASSILEYWKTVAKWIEKFYPDVNIYSINPVSLTIFPEKHYEITS
jgi:hypothetical protein